MYKRQSLDRAADTLRRAHQYRLLTTVELGRGWLSALLGQTEQLPAWLTAEGASICLLYTSQRVGSALLKILAHPVFQLFGLAHIDDLAGFIHHQINAGQQRQVVGFCTQFVFGQQHRPLSFLFHSVANILRRCKMCIRDREQA